MIALLTRLRGARTRLLRRPLPLMLCLSSSASGAPRREPGRRRCHHPGHVGHPQGAPCSCTTLPLVPITSSIAQVRDAHHPMPADGSSVELPTDADLAALSVAEGGFGSPLPSSVASSPTPSGSGGFDAHGGGGRGSSVVDLADDDSPRGGAGGGGGALAPAPLVDVDGPTHIATSLMGSLSVCLRAPLPSLAHPYVSLPPHCRSRPRPRPSSSASSASWSARPPRASSVRAGEELGGRANFNNFRLPIVECSRPGPLATPRARPQAPHQDAPARARLQRRARGWQRRRVLLPAR